MQKHEVVITTKNTPALTLGIIALVLGVIALLVGWIPFLGLIAIPVALIGCLLALIGFILSATTAFRGVAMPLVGGFICLLAVALPVFMTGSSSAAIAKAADETVREMESQRAQIALEREQEENHKAEQKASYIANNIDLYDFEARYMDSILDGRVPGVEFKLKNNGDKVLNQVEVTVYFQDAAGNTIAEEDFYPVLVTDYSFSGDRKPLKPGYVWQQENGRFYSAKSVPSEWAEGRATAKITDIEFAD
jgi:hypothetical protein